MCDIRHWGHIFHNIPILVSDAFAYGNKKSMTYYTSTYDFILKNDLLLKGKFINAFETYLTDSILQHVMDPDRSPTPVISRDEIIYKYNNIPNGCKIHTILNFYYYLLPCNLRSKNNFVVNLDNVFEYTQL